MRKTFRLFVWCRGNVAETQREESIMPVRIAFSVVGIAFGALVFVILLIGPADAQKRCDDRIAQICFSEAGKKCEGLSNGPMTPYRRNCEARANERCRSRYHCTL
jgi:hypothetical protein